MHVPPALARSSALTRPHRTWSPLPLSTLWKRTTRPPRSPVASWSPVPSNSIAEMMSAAKRKRVGVGEEGASASRPCRSKPSGKAGEAPCRYWSSMFPSLELRTARWNLNVCTATPKYHRCLQSSEARICLRQTRNSRTAHRLESHHQAASPQIPEQISIRGPQAPPSGPAAANRVTVKA